jgi:hypothetical protein
VTKIKEKVVDARYHISKYNLLIVFQSAYHPFHSTEMAIICVMNNMLKAVDHGNVSALAMRGKSAAFTTVDTLKLKDVTQRRFEIRRNALNWLVNFLMDRTQDVDPN